MIGLVLLGIQTGWSELMKQAKTVLLPAYLKQGKDWYKKDKVVALSYIYIAAERNVSFTYRTQTDEMRYKAAASGKW